MQNANAVFIIHSYTAQKETWRHAWAGVKLKSTNKNGLSVFFFLRTVRGKWKELDTNLHIRSVYR